MKARATLSDMTTVASTRVKDLDLSVALPPDIKVINTLALVIDPEAVSSIEKGLSELGQLKLIPANLPRQVRCLVLGVNRCKIKKMFMANNGGGLDNNNT